MIDYSRITPLLTKAIQDLNHKLEDLATTTPEANWEGTSFVARFFTALKGRLIAWFADAANGIHDLYAAVIHVNEVHTKDFARRNRTAQRPV